MVIDFVGWCCCQDLNKQSLFDLRSLPRRTENRRNSATLVIKAVVKAQTIEAQYRSLLILIKFVENNYLKNSLLNPLRTFGTHMYHDC